MAKKQNVKCLMIRTKDDKVYFTNEENYSQLIEFSKAVGAEISVVKVKEAEVLDLVSLAPAICIGKKFTIKKPDVEIIETRIERPRRERKKLLRNAKKIRSHIRELLSAGEIVKLSDVAKKFRRYKLTLAAFSNHLRAIREEFAKKGQTVERIGHGEYKLR